MKATIHSFIILDNLLEPRESRESRIAKVPVLLVSYTEHPQM